MSSDDEFRYKSDDFGGDMADLDRSRMDDRDLLTNSTVCETGGRTIEEDRSTETRETPYEGVLNTHESETNMLETPGRDVTGGARPDAHVTMRKKQGVKETPPATSEVVD